MNHIDMAREGKICKVTLNRGKVHALNETLVDEIREAFETMADDDSISAVVLTGSGSFFSFGFDIPELYPYTREAFARFLTKVTDLFRYLFLYPKPIVAAINGHAMAGGCMLATTCDYRVMVTGKAKISLNEITFGASVFQGSVEQLRYSVGSAVAQEMLFSGAMYSAEEALKLGLVHALSTIEELHDRTRQIAEAFAVKNPAAFQHMKKMLRSPVMEGMESKEQESITEFIQIWYSDSLRESLSHIKIHT